LYTYYEKNKYCNSSLKGCNALLDERNKSLNQKSMKLIECNTKVDGKIKQITNCNTELSELQQKLKQNPNIV